MSEPRPASPKMGDDASDAGFSDLQRTTTNPESPGSDEGNKSPQLAPSTPGGSPRLSRNPSFSNSSSYQEDWEAFPPLDKLTMFDLLENLALPQQLEKLHHTITTQTEKVRRQRDALRTKGTLAKDRVVEEWRRRVPTADEQLDRYRKRMQSQVNKLGKRWNDTKAVTLREKIAFIGGVLNIFISGFLMGGYPEYFHIWYTVQLLYFMPLRYFAYHKKGYHYFLADLCYFVNLLCLLSIWVFPNSKRLFISTYCLAYGNNAVAIAMWRNSMVFHSMDKVVSLFIHIMPPATLHCIVHMIPTALQKERYPAVYNIRNSAPGSPEHYGLFSMFLWSTIPYALWQLSYHFFITVRRAKQIAAGRPTSFTWLRKSYSKVWIGKIVLSLPESLQEPAFMLIQYSYALLTMTPCPLWFWYRYLSAAFLMAVFCWSIYNGATFYIDVFGKRFQNELEAMKREVQKWQSSPDLAQSPLLTPQHEASQPMRDVPSNAATDSLLGGHPQEAHHRSGSFDKIPLLSEDRLATSSSLDDSAKDIARERKSNQQGPA